MCSVARWILPGLLTIAIALVTAWATLLPLKQQELAGRLREMLRNTHPWAEIAVDGRDVRLSGVAEKETAREAALAALGADPGVRRVEDAAAVLPLAAPFVFSAEKRGDRVVLEGAVPPSAHDAIVARARPPAGGFEDRLVESVGAGEGFTEAALGALDRLKLLGEGRLEIRDGVVSLTGRARDARAYAALAGPSGRAAPGVAPAAIAPFALAAVKDATGTRLVGHVPSFEAKARLVRLAGGAGSVTASNDLLVAAGAPEGFERAAAIALAQLPRLEDGRVDLAEKRATVTGRAVSPAAERAIVADLARLARLGWTVTGGPTPIPRPLQAVAAIGEAAPVAEPAFARPLTGQGSAADRLDPNPLSLTGRGWGDWLAGEAWGRAQAGAPPVMSLLEDAASPVPDPGGPGAEMRESPPPPTADALSGAPLGPAEPSASFEGAVPAGKLPGSAPMAGGKAAAADETAEEARPDEEGAVVAVAPPGKSPDDGATPRVPDAAPAATPVAPADADPGDRAEAAPLPAPAEAEGAMDAGKPPAATVKAPEREAAPDEEGAAIALVPPVPSPDSPDEGRASPVPSDATPAPGNAPSPDQPEAAIVADPGTPADPVAPAATPKTGEWAAPPGDPRTLDRSPSAPPGASVVARRPEPGAAPESAEWTKAPACAGAVAPPPIRFENAKAVVTETGMAALDDFAKRLSTCPEARIRIVGRADPMGSREFNRRLSEVRAFAVRHRLVAAGVDPARIDIVAAGEDGGAEAWEPGGDAAMRRVDFGVESGDAPAVAVPR